MHTTPLTDQQLKYFGGSLSLLLLAFAAIAHWRFDAAMVAGGLAAGAIVMVIVYYSLPKTRRPIYKGFRIVTLPIQLTVSVVLLAIVYYLILTPIGLGLRLTGTSVRKTEPGESGWKKCDSERDASQYFETY